MIYQVIKAIHVASVMSFISGLLILAVAAKANNLVVLRTVRRWDRCFTLPALGLVWITGLTIAIQGQWFGNTWLTIKLITVAGLSGLHGVLTGALRRIEFESTATVPEFLRQAGVVVIAAITVISFLVILKPAVPSFRAFTGSQITTAQPAACSTMAGLQNAELHAAARPLHRCA
ncbi:CopD family protein [Noviherbaspirillum sp. CPCC 100848]|uniref:CopD family protein n=1 Tax=Noviherbaspirillum album TaxID=3080276 RepID=A0ABU6JAU5_9BURK|nr:CopD family protein [Noviherbaspirillum sp. CPCC 100848]MEC4720769.1 CopD family protein [Noviherbaspirillum sp. CPCC 100848]